MPNWISNQLTISDTKKTLVVVAETCRKTTSDGKIIPFSLDSIVPMPGILKQTENSTGVELGLFDTPMPSSTHHSFPLNHENLWQCTMVIKVLSTGCIRIPKITEYSDMEELLTEVDAM